MFKSLLFRWSPLRRIPKECMFNFAEVKSNVRDTQWRQLSISVSCYKKRRPAEEKAIESHGRGVIRYSPKAGTEVVGIWRNMTVQDIAKVLNKDVDHVFRALEFADKNSDVRYTPSTVIHNQQIVRDVIKISGCRFKIVPPPDEIVEDERNKDALPPPPAPESELLPRPPVVCVMGHVDHGKTTLLDALRDSSIVDDEFGGITQHIGAFVVKLPAGDSVTFLDTPGHAAFSAMRARGAHTADVVVLVVAGDDGVMDQTLEAVRMAREAAVPIVVAVNKIDKPGVNIERTLASLASHGVVAESLGGEVQAVAISAKQRTGLQDLLAALLLQASLLELKAPVGPPVTGVVLDTSLGAATGKQATVLVQRGTLQRGCVLVAGQGWGKVRLLLSAEGQPLSSAGPSLPARVLGWRDLPAAGDLVLEVGTEQRAREVVRWRESQRLKQKAEDDLPEVIAREEEHREQYLQHLRKKRSLGRMRLRREGPRAKMLQEDTHPALRVIVKGDVDGSVEAILDVLDTYDEHDRVRLDLVHFGVGALTPGDIEIAEAFKAVIYLFNVECSPALAAEAKSKNVPVKAHNVIYRLVDDVKAEINDRIPPVQEEEILGEANVLQEFHISEGKKKVPVAGCRCVRGVLQRNARYRLVRSGEVVYDGKLVSMKHLKDEVSSIKRDMECGLRLADAGVSLRPGDQLVCYVMRDAKPSTGWDPGF